MVKMPVNHTQKGTPYGVGVHVNVEDMRSGGGRGGQRQLNFVGAPSCHPQSC